MEKSLSPIAQYRANAKLTLEDLGERLGVNKTTVMRWEHKRVPAGRLTHVEKMTGIPRYLLRPDIFVSA